MEEDSLKTAFQMRSSSTYKTAKMLILLCINAIRHAFCDKPCIGNLSVGLESEREGDGKREKVRRRLAYCNFVSRLN